MLKRRGVRYLSFFSNLFAKSSVDDKLSKSLLSATLSKQELRIAKAFLTYQEAVNELSAGQNHLSMKIPPQILSTLKSKEEKDMNIHELELLARYHMENINDPSKAEDHMQRAIHLWKQSMKLGSAESKSNIAICLKDGRGMEKDSAQSFLMLSELARDHDHALAHYYLGIMCSTGEGTAVDHTKAFNHLKAAAKGGVLNALYLIAEAYADGLGVKQDDIHATRFYEAAALAGDPLSQFKLGNRLLRGIGVKQDAFRAFEMQLDAANQGLAAAVHNVADHYYSGVGVEQSFVIAAQWFEKAAIEGNFPESGVNLANMYYQGIGVKQDVDKAIAILSRFTDHAPSQQLLEEYKQPR